MVHRKSIGIQASHFVYGSRCLDPRAKAIEGLHYELESTSVEIDELDKRILVSLSLNAPPTLQEIARSVRAPYATVERRVKQLREAGIFVRTTALLEFPFLHHFVVLVYTRSPSRALKEQLIRLASRTPEVFYLVECLGAWDYEVGVTVLRSADVQRVVRLLYEQLKGCVVDAKVLPLLHRHKVQDYPSTL